jgi:hypothetical protein
MARVIPFKGSKGRFRVIRVKPNRGLICSARSARTAPRLPLSRHLPRIEKIVYSSLVLICARIWFATILLSSDALLPTLRMSHEAENEQRQTYVLIWGESDNASSVKCMALVRMWLPACGCRILRAFLDVDCNNAGQDYGSFDTQPAPYKAHLGGARWLLGDDCRHTISCPDWIITRGRFSLLRSDVSPML